MERKISGPFSMIVFITSVDKTTIKTEQNANKK
jgi:hypothetical protein